MFLLDGIPTYVMSDIVEKFPKTFERLEVEDEQYSLEFLENNKKKGPLSE